MNFATLTKTNTHNYILSDHNNEKLKVIVEFFLNKELLSEFKHNFKTFRHMSNITDGHKFEIAYIPHDEINQQSTNILVLTLYNLYQDISESNPLVIEIESKKLLDIIEKLEDYIKLKSDTIKITEKQDEYIITEVK